MNTKKKLEATSVENCDTGLKVTMNFNYLIPIFDNVKLNKS